MKKVTILSLFLLSQNTVLYGMHAEKSIEYAIEDCNNAQFAEGMSRRKMQVLNNPITEYEYNAMEKLATCAYEKAQKQVNSFTQGSYVIGFSKDLAGVAASAALISVGMASAIVTSVIADKFMQDDTGQVNTTASHIRNVGIATGVTNTTIGLVMGLRALKSFYDHTKVRCTGNPSEWEKQRSAAQRRCGDALATLRWLENNKSTLLNRNSASIYGTPIRQSPLRQSPPELTTTVSFSSSDSRSQSFYDTSYPMDPAVIYPE